MTFIFSTSHLPETRIRRPDHLEDEDDDDVMQPMPRAGGVRAFSHLPVRDNPAPSTAPLREDSPPERDRPDPSTLRHTLHLRIAHGKGAG